MDVHLKYVITDDTGLRIYRLIDIDSGFMADANEDFVNKHLNEIDTSNYTNIHVRDINKYSGRVLTGLNDFETWCRLNHRLDLLYEYDTTRNNKSISNISKAAVDRVWWKCSKCGYEWKAVIKSRTTGNQYGPSGCPKCLATLGRGVHVITGVNDLETWCKENNKLTLLKEYNEAYNKIPANKVACRCSKMANWKCARCGKVYSSLVVNRTKNSTGCKFCTSGIASYPELMLYIYLSEYFNDVKYRYKINRLEIDIYIKDINLGVDYRGMYWHLTREDIDNQKEMDLENLGINQLIIIEDNKSDLCGRYLHVNGSTQPMKMIEMVSRYIRNTYKVNIEFNRKVYEECEKQAKFLKNNKIAVNNITITHPHVLEIWDYEKNGDFRPETVTYGTKYKAWFKCKHCGNSFYRSIREIINQSKCPMCKEQLYS